MATYKHYGVDVSVKRLPDDKSFKELCEEQNVKYIEIPVREGDWIPEIYKIKRPDNSTGYALIVWEGMSEHEYMYVTSHVPDDMSWKNLLSDCNAQARGREPQELHTVFHDVLMASIRMAHATIENEYAEGKLSDTMNFDDYEKTWVRANVFDLLRRQPTNMDWHDIPENLLSRYYPSMAGHEEQFSTKYLPSALVEKLDEDEGE